jgi:malate synthase A
MLADMSVGMPPLSLEIAEPPAGDEEIFATLFNPAAREFLARTVAVFDAEVDSLVHRRQLTRLQMEMSGSLPTFSATTTEENPPPDADWRISPVPERLRRRHIDIGDVSPADTEQLARCLASAADGVQVDFDDGHCPTWHNQLVGWHNILLAVAGRLPGGPPSLADAAAPVMMLRPRAWNMTENRVLVGGRAAPGPLVDFALIMFHVGRELFNMGAGPFFYLSKLESAQEARLWNDIFLYVEAQLALPVGAVRSCVLIENILAAFQLDGILWALRDHSAGLNCGLWDYSASIISSFGHRAAFLLPDRKKYVSMERPFLDAYLRLVVQAAHARGAPATGGMAAVILAPGETARRAEQVAAVMAAKRREIAAGVAGFLVYDQGLVEPARRLWAEFASAPSVPSSDVITADDLLTLPKAKER